MLWLVRLLFLFSTVVFALDSFSVASIKVDGLVNVSKNTFNENFIIHKNDMVNESLLKKAMLKLYQSKFFSDVQINKVKNSGLIVKVIERPMVSFVSFTGQKTLQKDEIEKLLKQAKLQAGRPYDAKLAEQIKAALLQFSQEQGVNAIKIKIEVEKLTNNRVRVVFVFDESDKVKVSSIKFVGNEKISSKNILNTMQLNPHFWSFISDNDKYSLIRLKKDLLAIKNLYLNFGYINAKIVKKSVKVANDKVAIVINISEGKQYILGETRVVGKANAENLSEFLSDLSQGSVFSRETVVAVIDKISAYYKDKGYAYVVVDSKLRVNNDKVVDLYFNIKKGSRVVVRHISFFGNSSTNDKVLRREMLQHEAEMYSSSHVAESVRKINNLGYIKNARCDLSPIKNHQDQANLNCFVTESPVISASVSLGYGSQNGALFQLNFSHKSLLGTGYGVRFNATRMVTAESASISLYNPYFTNSGISQNISLNVERFSPAVQHDANWYARSNISFENKGIKLAVDYGVPVSQLSRLFFGAAIRTTDIKLGNNPDASYQNFISKYGNKFEELSLRLGFNWNNLNQAIFPTLGGRMNFDLEAGMPVSDFLRYYKLDLTANWYHPLTANSDWIFKTRGGIGFGRGYGSRGSNLPFFKNYFAGGMDTIRGFAANSLGVKDSEDRAVGGSMRAYGSLALILPQWFNEDVRVSMFVDAGALGVRRVSADDLRYAAGVSLQWRTAIAPLVFSLAIPLENHDKDQKELFAFELGTVF